MGTYILDYNPVLLYFIAQIVPNSFSLLQGPFDMFSCGGCWMLFESFLCFLPSSRISHFLQDSWFLLLENCIESQDLGSGHIRCFWSGVASRPSKMTEQENTCECISW